MAWFNFGKKKPNTDNTESMINALERIVTNAATSALTGMDLFKFMRREKNYNTIERGLQLSAVFCALNLYSSSVATLPRNVMAVDTVTGEATNKVTSVEGKHPAIRIFLAYANRGLSSDDMMTMISNDLLVDGNFYALRESDSQGRTFNIHYIHPSRIPKGNIYYATGKEKLDNGRVIGEGELVYRIETGTSTATNKPKAILVTRDEIVHLKSAIFDAEYNRGVGIIENAQRSFSFAENTEIYGSKFYEKGTNSQTFLSTEQTLGSGVIKELEGFFAKNPNAPLEEAFKTRIIDRGLKPINVTIPLGQLQFIETKAFAVEDIARWFAIPPELLHSRMGTGSSGMDMAELVNNYIQWGIGPFITRIGNQLRDELLPISSRLSYSFEFERIYLYRTVINEFSQAIRNLFEIGVLNRMQIGKLIGIHVDPKDKQNRQLYVPTNLMTVQHGMALEQKAETANELIAEQVKKAKLDNENYTSPKDMATLKSQQSPTASPDSKLMKDDLDESPDQQNEDKKIRTAKNAFNAVVLGLEDYRVKVLTQKSEKYKDIELLANVMQWEKEKFYPLVQTNMVNWSDILSEMSSFNSIEDINCDTWLTLVSECKGEKLETST
jgi:HK97 family phage portal protein